MQLTLDLLDKIIARSDDPKWLEFRGAVLTDNKDFKGALRDYDAAIRISDLRRDPPAVRGRLLSGRALVREGLSDWPGALKDYDAALDVTGAAGITADPYVLNSRGNVLSSLERWRDAREAYLESSRGFQSAKGFYDPSTGTTSTQRLDGAVFAASNAALVLVQLGRPEVRWSGGWRRWTCHQRRVERSGQIATVPVTPDAIAEPFARLWEKHSHSASATPSTADMPLRRMP